MDYNCVEETNWECYSRKIDLDAPVTYVIPDRNLATPVTLSPPSLERKLLDIAEIRNYRTFTDFR